MSAYYGQVLDDVTVSATAPVDPYPDQLWWKSTDNTLYRWQDPSWIPQGTSGTVSWDDISGKPETFPPTVPISQNNIAGLTSSLALKAPLASPAFTGTPTVPTAALGTNTTQIASTAFVEASVVEAISELPPPDVDVSWDEVSGKPVTFPPTVPIAWANVSETPTTYPPTLPIAQAGVTNLITDLSGKAPTVHAHTTADITGLDTVLTGKASTVHTHAQADVTNLTTDLAALMPKSGGTFTNKVTFTPNSTFAGINIGVESPSSLVNGDIYVSAGGSLVWRGGGSTIIGVSLSQVQTISGVKTFSAKPIMPTPAAGTASINLPHGVTPSVPANGDLWSETTGFYGRVNGATVGPFGTGGAGAADWNTLLNKPATFPPTVPIPQADITNLTTDLAGKAALAGAIFTGKVTTPVAVLESAGINISGGVAGLVTPTTLVDGDMWMSSALISYRNNGTTYTVVNTGNTQTIVGAKTFSSSGNIISGKLTIAASTTVTRFAITHGTVPTTPTDGDMWSTSAGGFYGRVNGVTKNLSIHVGTTAPASPITNDLWLDIN